MIVLWTIATLIIVYDQFCLDTETLLTIVVCVFGYVLKNELRAQEVETSLNLINQKLDALNVVKAK